MKVTHFAHELFSETNAHFQHPSTARKKPGTSLRVAHVRSALGLEFAGWARFYNFWQPLKIQKKYRKSRAASPEAGAEKIQKKYRFKYRKNTHFDPGRCKNTESLGKTAPKIPKTLSTLAKWGETPPICQSGKGFVVLGCGFP